MSTCLRRRLFLLTAVLAVAFLVVAGAPGGERPQAPERSVTVRVSPSAQAGPVTGRVFLLVSRRLGGEPRLLMPLTFAYYFNEPAIPYPQAFGVDVEGLVPGDEVLLDEDTLGYPLASLRDLPPGEYAVQAVLHVYTRCERADGHTVWVPWDQGEGQQFHLSPGNLYSDPQRLRVEAGGGFQVDLDLTRVIPPIPRPPDSKYVKRLRIRSALVSEFWGRDVVVGATVILPKGYDEHPEVRYPALYYQGHFFEDPAFGFPEPLTEEVRRRRPFSFQNLPFQQAWLSDDFPRMIIVTFQHATPFYDDSYAVNSANNGPWGDAFIQELIPAVEERFRIIRKGYARVMTGGSTGGWVSAALQIQHPDFFGGAWAFCPDPVDFREFLNVDIYREENAFFPSGYDWLTPERPVSRTVEGLPRVTVRQASRFTRVLGSRGRSGEFLDMWNAAYGPVGPDGYPVPLWDYETGVIDKEVAAYWRDHGYDLRQYLEARWSEIGPSLVGKLHFICGDMDNFYLNLAVYRMEDFLERTSAPAYGGSFLYGRPLVGHGWYGFDPMPMKLLETMAAHVAANAPAGEEPSSWRYN